MLSIVICSFNNKRFQTLHQNVRKTIGEITYEIVRIDNSKNIYSISEAYNNGIQKAQYSTLLFIHEDILFHTQEWGRILISILENDSIGLVGVAGAKIKTRMPSAWWDCPEAFKAINIIQHGSQAIKKRYTGFKKKAEEIEVVVIDGVFMAMRKNDQIYFNTELKGFHNYDLNLSFENLFRGKKTVVTNKILIEHFSSGSINRSWVESSLKLHDIYGEKLPLLEAAQDPKVHRELEVRNGVKFLEQLNRFGIMKEAFYQWGQIWRMKPASKIHWKIFKMFIS